MSDFDGINVEQNRNEEKKKPFFFFYPSHQHCVAVTMQQELSITIHTAIYANATNTYTHTHTKYMNNCPLITTSFIFRACYLCYEYVQYMYPFAKDRFLHTHTHTYSGIPPLYTVHVLFIL